MPGRRTKLRRRTQSRCRGDLHRQPRLARAARACQRDEPVVGERLTDAIHFRLAPNETRQLRRKTLGGNGIGSAQRREVVVQIWVTELHHPFGAGQIAQRMGAQVGERDVWRELVDDKRFRRAGQHGLTAVGQVAQPGGAVDRRADVVGLVAQLYVAGVDADAQLDRCQRCPLQVQRTGHRVGGARERDHEAVALALFHGSHALVGGDRVRQCLVEARDSGLHRLGLGLPQPGRTLDVGQQQRHGSRRKLAHVHVAPASFAHASQHAATCSAEHQRNRQ